LPALSLRGDGMGHAYRRHLGQIRAGANNSVSSTQCLREVQKLKRPGVSEPRLNE
jgi:hypothetical protein